jgi:hypothetical protein
LKNGQFLRQEKEETALHKILLMKKINYNSLTTPAIINKSFAQLGLNHPLSFQFKFFAICRIREGAFPLLSYAVPKMIR